MGVTPMSDDERTRLKENDAVPEDIVELAEEYLT